jgi:hypothetical protein
MLARFFVTGYWLGDGSLTKNAVMFCPRKESDIKWLDETLVRVGLQLGVTYTKSNASVLTRQVTFRVPRWWNFFAREYGKKYRWHAEHTTSSSSSSGAAGSASAVSRSHEEGKSDVEVPLAEVLKSHQPAPSQSSSHTPAES